MINLAKTWLKQAFNVSVADGGLSTGWATALIVAAAFVWLVL